MLVSVAVICRQLSTMLRYVSCVTVVPPHKSTGGRVISKFASGHTAMSIRVVIVDDHPAIRTGIRSAISKTGDIMVVGEAARGDDALFLIDQLRPDVALLDCRLPGVDGTRVAQLIHARGLETRVLALSAYTDEHYVQSMLLAGATGYLLKEEALDTVIDAIRAVHRGEVWYSREVMSKVADLARSGANTASGQAGLTDREMGVLRLLARGWDNQRIAKDLHISEGTVKNHVTSIYTKLDVRTRAEAVAWAWRYGEAAER